MLLERAWEWIKETAAGVLWTLGILIAIPILIMAPWLLLVLLFANDIHESEQRKRRRRAWEER